MESAEAKGYANRYPRFPVSPAGQEAFKVNSSSKRQFGIAGGFVILMWMVFVVNAITPLDLNRYGLVPRSVHGSVGIITAPLLHQNLAHIVSNTVPLIGLLFLLAASNAHTLSTLLAIIILGGVGLWLFGPSNTLNIGASGLVYGLIVFLMTDGIVEKKVIKIVVGFGVLLLYGGTLLMGVIPGPAGISWQGHLFGAIAGGLVAYYGPREKRNQDKRDLE